jgi:hypothetical protein
MGIVRELLGGDLVRLLEGGLFFLGNEWLRDSI